MIDLFAEGIESMRLPCSWGLLILGVGMSIFGRRRTLAVTGVFVAVAGLVAFARFGGWWFAVPNGWTQVALGVGLVGLTAAAYRLDHVISDVALSAYASVVAVSAWIPCVGPHLGDLLNSARLDPWPHLGGTIAFMVGLTIPFTIVAAVGSAFPGLASAARHPTVVRVGSTLLVLIGLLFVATWFDDVSSELARRSTF